MTAIVIDATERYLAKDGVVVVVFPIPVGKTINRIHFADLRYLSSANPELTEQTTPAIVRLEVPGSGAIAPDEEVAAVVATATQRANGEVDVLIRLEETVPPPDPEVPYTQLSIRFRAFPDQPTDSTAGLTQRQRLFVDV